MKETHLGLETHLEPYHRLSPLPRHLLPSPTTAWSLTPCCCSEWCYNIIPSCWTRVDAQNEVLLLMNVDVVAVLVGDTCVTLMLQTHHV
jgi:hypothetical protein